MFRYWLLISCVVGVLFGAPDSTALREFDSKILEHQQRTDSIRVLISTSETELQALSSQESEQLNQLNEIEKLAAVSQGYMDSVAVEITAVKDSMNLLASRIDTLEDHQAHRQGIMAQRLRQIYALGTPSLISIVVGGSSPQEMVRRVAAMEQLSAYDEKLMRSIASAKEDIELERELLASHETYLHSLVVEREEQNVQLQERLGMRKELLTSIQTEKAKWGSAVQELLVAQEELSSLVVSLVAKRKTLSAELERSQKLAFEKRKGRLMWPVDGKVLVDFGRIVHPVYKTVTVSKGIVIEAPKGRSVRCVAQGKVSYVGRLRGYGQIVVMDHGGGYSTVYTHLDQVTITAAQEVTTGERIGTVGESGSLDGSKLRFEIRSAQGAVDPKLWLSPVAPSSTL